MCFWNSLQLAPLPSFGDFSSVGGGVDRTWFALVCLNTALVYTHYYGWVVVGMQGLFVFLERRRMVAYFAQGLLLAALYTPWVLAALGGAAAEAGLPNISWISRPSLGHVASYYSELAGRVPILWGARIGLVLCFIPIVILFWKILKARGLECDSMKVSVGLLLMSSLPVVVSFGVSWLGSQSIWGERHLIISAIPFLLLVAMGVKSIESLRWRRTSMTLIAAWALTAGFFGITKEDRKLAWESLINQLAEQTDGGPVNVYCLENFTYLPLTFYVKERHYQNLAVKEVNKVPAEDGEFWLVVRKAESEIRDALVETREYDVGQPVTIKKQYTSVSAYPITWAPTKVGKVTKRDSMRESE